MKKRFSTLTVIIIGFLMMATGVVASSYYHWAGSVDFNESMNTMDKIQIGIDLLKGDLKTEKTNHAGTKAELENLRTQLGLEDGQDSKEALENLIAERNTLQNNINLIATEASKYIVDLNEINGTGPKYEYLVKNVNANIDYLYNLSDTVATDRKHLNKNPGNGPKDNQLEQAIKDMQDIKNKSEDTLGVFDEETRSRIENEHEYEEYVPEEEEEATDTGEEDN